MTNEPNPLERWRAAYAALSRDCRGSHDCPSSTTLWDAVHGELPADRTREVIEHTIECAACAEGWRLAREVAAGLPAGRTGARSRSWLRRPEMLVAAAAVLAVALALPFVLHDPSAPPASSFRTGEESAIRSLLAEELALARDDCVLRWSNGPPGSVYDVYVATEELRIVSRATGLESAEYRIDPSHLVGVEPGSRLVWRITARAPDGRTLRSSSFLATVE